MQISSIWMSQKNLRRAGQIPALMVAIHNGDLLPKIVLSRAEDGEIQVEDGHHRLTAYWLSGRDTLYPHEFQLVEKDQWRPRFGNIVTLVR